MNSKKANKQKQTQDKNRCASAVDQSVLLSNRKGTLQDGVRLATKMNIIGIRRRLNRFISKQGTVLAIEPPKTILSSQSLPRAVGI